MPYKTLSSTACPDRRQIPSSLDDILRPMPADVFLHDVLGQSVTHIPGESTKFSQLFPWARLNEVLSQNRLRPPRFRLYKLGVPVDAREYIHLRDGEAHVKGAELHRLWSDGGTVILDNADELYEPLGSLVASIEWAMRMKVNANLYAAVGSEAGFGLHWDSQDTFILQVAGRKHWTIHRPTRVHPIRNDSVLASEPSSDPIWRGTLEQGGFIYIPRGWWHVAVPVAEPSLHLTITLNMHNGLDFLHWMVDRLKDSIDARADLPQFALDETKKAYLLALQRDFEAIWTAESLDHFIDYQDGHAFAREQFHLPCTPPDIEQIDDNATIRIVSSRRLFVTPTEGDPSHLTCISRGRACTLDATWEPVIQLLNRQHECNWSDIRRICTEKSTPQLLNGLKALIGAGTVVVEGNGYSNRQTVNKSDSLPGDTSIG